LKPKRRLMPLERAKNSETNLTERKNFDLYHRKEAEVELEKVTKMEVKLL
jgi:hypothetical protein